MSVAGYIKRMLDRVGPRKTYPPVAVSDDHVIYLEDTDSSSYLGAFFVGLPMTGANDQTVNRLKSVMSSGYPPGTFVQLAILSIPDIDDQLSAWYLAKVNALDRSPHLDDDQKAILLDFAMRRFEYYQRGKSVPHIKASGVRCNKQIFFATIKYKCATQKPSENEVGVIREAAAKFEQGLKATGFPIRQGTVNDYLAVLRYCFDPFAPGDYHYDDEQTLRDQVHAPGFKIETYDKEKRDYRTMKLGENFVKLLSVKRLPKSTSLAVMNYMIGDPDGLTNQVTEPYLLTLTIHYPDQITKNRTIRTKYTIVQQQAYGPLLKFSPRLAYKKNGFDVLIHELEQGGTPCEMNLQMVIYSQDRDRLTRLSSGLSTFYSSFGMEMVEDSEILWPIFWNSLPLFPSTTSISKLERYRTMSVRQAIQFTPSIGEWTGTGRDAAMLLETRRGQPFFFDLYHSQTNYNAIIAAESGAGKSVITQELIQNYLSLGAKVWVIDVGGSYYKLCRALGGEFITFNEQSQFCLNPFTKVEDIDEDMDLLMTLLSKMAMMEGTLDGMMQSFLQEAIKAVWGDMGNTATVNDIATWLRRQDDSRAVDLGRMLFPFTRQGAYSHWFNGVNNLNFHSNFIVLELESLKMKPHLQHVVLIQLLAKINHEMYLAEATSRGRKKVAVIDEAWELLQEDEMVAQSVAAAYRKYRKHEGAAVTIVQSIADYYLNKRLEAIAKNSANMLILQQKPETIDHLKKDSQLSIGDYGFDLLKTVHTTEGQYSEIFVYQNNNWGVARLVIDRPAQILYSTKGPARHLIIEQIENGVPVNEAIDDYIVRYG